MSTFEISELKTDGAIEKAYPVLAELRPHLRAEAFVEQVRLQQREGYRLIGGFVAGRLVAAAGFRIGRTLSRGQHLFVDDLVTTTSEQGKGYGAAMLKYLGEMARAEGITKIWLDSRDTARTFYEKVGFSVHTSLPCWIEVERLG
jgi:GNAT superfamily N-acetyltransferase